MFLLIWSIYTTKTIIAFPFESKFNNDENQEVLIWRNRQQRKVKSYIDNNLNPVKVNVIDPIKDNLTQPLSIKEILDNLEILKGGYYRALAISKK